jgi:hypothetical protein
MPTKRRKIGARRIGVMTDSQKWHLVCSCYFFDFNGEADHFVDEEHRRATWALHRAEILASWDHPGRRPDALWSYDFGLKPAPYPREWAWPRRVQREDEMVHRLLVAGQLESCRSNGLVPITSEIEEIEASWRKALELGSGYWTVAPAWFARRIRGNGRRKRWRDATS